MNKKTTINFPDIFNLNSNHDLTLNLVNDARKARDAVKSDWIEQEPIIYTSIDDISLDRNRFVVDIKSIWYECLFLPATGSDTLVVSFSGGGRTAKNRYPKFLRWKYANKLGVHMLCIDDPMYKGNNYTSVRWYYGTKDTSYLKELVSVINKIAEKLNIKYSNIYFIGSSGGGYAANYMANIMDGTNSISMNPQFLLNNWRDGNASRLFKSLYDIDISDNTKDIHNRNSFIITAKKSVFFEVINVSSPDDFDSQFIPFCKLNGIKPSYGVTVPKKNVITWLHCTDSFHPHLAILTDIGILISLNLITHYRKFNDVSGFHGLSLLLNEELKEKYALLTKLAYTSYWKKALNHVCYNLPNNVIQSYDLEKNYVRFYFRSLIDNKNIYYVIHRPNENEGEEQDEPTNALFTYGFIIRNNTELLKNIEIIKLLKTISKKWHLVFGKKQSSIRLSAKCATVNEAAYKLHLLIKNTNESIANIIRIHS